jgi:GNAT superfamily N-acetyltransferase
MSSQLIVHPAQAGDYQARLTLWHGYCAALDGNVAASVTEGVWRRILSPHETIWSLLACRGADEPIGLANYVLHPHTWSLQTVRYLEDLFVAPDDRGNGAGEALINGLVALGRRHGWQRVYWQTHDDNHRARSLYGRIVPRTDYVRYDIEIGALPESPNIV